ncbi:phenylacetate--CoA ligase [Pseudonocardia ailaonensis]|uniref:Phenylacetate--CoA ligase n=1 Tax=Pseudonocardia ailaonensis TaxID=367279 RepID=A0ABN2N9E6_9PSEU
MSVTSSGSEIERKALEAWQAERLRDTVAHVVGNSPYWARRFADAGIDPSSVTTPADLYRCPTLTKRDYIDVLAESPGDYGGLLCEPLADVMANGANFYRTTGTSGLQGRFVNTDEGSAVYGAQGAELLRSAGAVAGDTALLAFPLGLWAAGWGLYYGAKQAKIVVVAAGSPTDTAGRVQLLQDYRPAVVAVTPSYALTLGGALVEAHVDPTTLGVKGLLLGGETFSRSRRDRIEELWGVPGGTRNFFGISEGGPLFAVECAAQDGLHLFERDTIHQFWKPDSTEPAAPGELAEHVFTSIAHRTMATWFNFRTRDGAVYSDEPCPCGNPSRRMWIKERLDDMVKIRGINIFASAVEQILSGVPGASLQFRLVVERENEHDTVTVEVEMDPAADSAGLEAAAAAALRTAIGTRLDVRAVAPGTLPTTELKARRWLDKRPKD